MKWGRLYQNVTVTAQLLNKEFGADIVSICKEFDEIPSDYLVSCISTKLDTSFYKKFIGNYL